ncbi:MAG: FHA domain-containing protein, partial [Planctomycetota bacterium]
MAFLKVFTGGEERTVFLGDDPILFGRGQDTDVLLKDHKVSRHHCVIEPSGEGRWQVRDLGSGNGTKVNGRKVTSEELMAEDVVQVGDAKILFASEGVTVVSEPAAGAPPPARRSTYRRSGSSSGWIFVVLGLIACGAALYFVFGQGDASEKPSSEETLAYRAVLGADGDEQLVELAETYLSRYPRSSHSSEITLAVEAARKRIQNGTSAKAHSFDPTRELEGLTTLEAVKRLEEMLLKSKPEHRPAIRAALDDRRTRLHNAREKLFSELESVFKAHVEKGEYSRAREIWFFLGEEPDWVPCPTDYVMRIVQANQDLENMAAAARSRLLEEVGRAESSHDFKRARGLLLQAMPRFEGTSVTPSLRERLTFIERAMTEGVKGKPTRPKTAVRVDVGRKMKEALAGLKARDFSGTAASLRALAQAAKKERGYRELDARAREAEAAAALQAALVAGLGQGEVPPKQVRKRWRVLEGGPTGLKVRSKGKEIAYSWKEAPAELYLGLLEPYADKVERGHLGMAVIAHAIGSELDLTEALAVAYQRDRKHGALHRFVAARVRNEPVPEGGYVVDSGKLWTRKEYHRRKEEALIQGFQAQLDKAYAAIKADKSFKRLDKLRKRKDDLDKARVHAKELIYDEKKYFYPYRGTGREGEYNKVQQEVDRRVDAVRELWNDRMVVSVKASAEVERFLKQFDEAAQELEKRLVDVEEKVEEIAFLRAYFGKKFNIRNLFRDPDEKQLLEYSDEVTDFNPSVTGDITEIER